MSLLDNIHRYNQNLVWDVGTLSWVAMLQPATTGGGGGGGAVTIADGADVAEGATSDVAVQGDTAGTLSAKLRGLNKTTSDTLTALNSYTTAFEFSGSNPIYVGIAPQGSAKSAGVWQIRKLTYDGSSNPTDIQYAGGTRNFTSIWDNRAALIYS